MVKAQSSHFSEWSVQYPMLPIDPKAMLADQDYRYQVGTLRNINAFAIPIMEETIDAVAGLRKFLKEEIEQLED